MKILILGAGQVGSTVAHVLSKEAQNDITIVDNQYAPLASLKERYDIRTIRGNAASPAILEEADAENTDIIIAVTSSDEVNIVACQLAYTLFDIKLKVARIRSQDYIEHADIFGNGLDVSFHIDVVISPEILITNYIKNIIELPGAHDVLRFAKGEALMISIEIEKDSPLYGRRFSKIQRRTRHLNINYVAIYRDGEEFIPKEETILEEDDEIYFLCARPHAREVIELFKSEHKVAKKVTIAGGGNIGSQLAEALESFTRVKVIEHNADRAHHLAAQLDNSLILQGDCTDETLLFEENIEDTDLFCAVTNDDQTNILSAMLAKRLGAKFAISLINRASFLELIEEESNIDLAFSPQQVTLSTLLTYIRKGDIVQVYSLRSGNSEAMEIIAHGTEATSKIVGKELEGIRWPEGVVVAGLVRRGKVMPIEPTMSIEQNDHLILFITDKESIPRVEELFELRA